MRTVRSSVFETNSSSTHSLTYLGTQGKTTDMVDPESIRAEYPPGSVIRLSGLSFDDYESSEVRGWESKADYLYSLIVDRKGRSTVDVEAISDSYEFKMLSDVVYEYCGVRLKAAGTVNCDINDLDGTPCDDIFIRGREAVRDFIFDNTYGVDLS